VIPGVLLWELAKAYACASSTRPNNVVRRERKLMVVVVEIEVVDSGVRVPWLCLWR